MEAGSSPAPVRVIEPRKGFSLPSLRELWAERDLVYFLARREVSSRYKQSVIGVFWVVLQPLLLALVFSVFFGHLARVPSEPGVPYPPFAVSGMVLWLFFAGSHGPSRREHGRERGFDLKGVLPADHHPADGGVPTADRLLHRVRRRAGGDLCLRHRAADPDLPDAPRRAADVGVRQPASGCGCRPSTFATATSARRSRS